MACFDIAVCFGDSLQWVLTVDEGFELAIFYQPAKEP
jgi:hypothetical protein